MTASTPTQPVAAELIEELSLRINDQLTQLSVAQDTVVALRQEHQQLKQRLISKQAQTQETMTSTSEQVSISNPPTEAETTAAQTPAPESVTATTAAQTPAPESVTATTAPATASESNAAERKKAKSRAANRAAVELLCETYPQTFAFAKPKPLKIGIQEDLVADGKLSQTKIKRGLASYVRAFGYLKSQTDGTARINLAGEAEGAVTAGEAAHAASKLPAPRKPNKPRADAKKRPARANNKPNQQANKPRNQQAKVEKAPSPFDGLNDGQRMASKLDLLLSKHK
jgi:ProP effector